MSEAQQKVHHILPGAEYDDGPDGPKVINPTVCWAGSGGYWSEADINDVGDVLRVGVNRD